MPTVPPTISQSLRYANALAPCGTCSHRKRHRCHYVRGWQSRCRAGAEHLSNCHNAYLRAPGRAGCRGLSLIRWPCSCTITVLRVACSTQHLPLEFSHPPAAPLGRGMLVPISVRLRRHRRGFLQLAGLPPAPPTCYGTLPFAHILITRRWITAHQWRTGVPHQHLSVA
jgi:hypothetical protein